MSIPAAGAPVFRGNYQLNMDAKGRLAVPKKYRDCLEAESGPKMVITTGEYEDCLVVYPLPEWQRIEERLRQQPDLKPEADDEARAKAEWTCRLVIGNATDCDIDSHGRLLIPPPLREHAELEKQVRMVGQTEKFELWDESKWSARSAEEFTRNKDRIRQARSNWTGPAASS
ncbi:MAG: division/cell wall cluster transcriptional repressor MraZ [Thiotrichales bacterium]|nr:division/cell wall cluster transcriptional repressor MraZ [Thiotrichales bacterium]